MKRTEGSPIAMTIGLDLSQLAALERNPRKTCEGRLNGARFTARVAIPNYRDRIEARYDRRLESLDMDLPVRHFGLTITFDKPQQLMVHDQDRRLDQGLRDVLARFGAVTLRNASIPDRALSQRNVFQSLSFHIDRGPPQEDLISLFWRDPSDPEQRMPRSSSTLVLANAAAYFQAVKEGSGEHGFAKGYNLFEDEDVQPLIDDVMVELSWRAPENIGEVSLVDNATTLHASYYAHPELKGYPISVRYLY
jgi:hypothetical protein